MGLKRKASFEGVESLVLQGSVRTELISHPLISPAAATLAGVGSVAIASLVSAWALLRLRAQAGANPARSQLLSAASLILSFVLIVWPVTWWHYSIVAAPVFAGILAIRREMPARWRLLLPLGYLLMVAQRGEVLLLSIIPILALSSIFLGGLLLWWLASIRYAAQGGNS